jgi:hypothetical protein
MTAFFEILFDASLSQSHPVEAISPLLTMWNFNQTHLASTLDQTLLRPRF